MVLTIPAGPDRTAQLKARAEPILERLATVGDFRPEALHEMLRDVDRDVAGYILARYFLSNPDKGEAGILEPYYYQAPAVGHVVYQTWDYQDYLYPTGAGKTVGVSQGAALRMYFQTEKAAIIAATDEQTRYIRDTVHEYYSTGSDLFRNALIDSPRDQVKVQRPNGEISVLFCKTANLNNEGNTLLGLQGLTTIYLDERSILPDNIFTEKIDRITAPKGRRRFMAGITTTQVANHTYGWTEGDQLPKRERVDPLKPHITAQGGAVFKATWRDCVTAGRFDQAFVDARYTRLGHEQFEIWYECEWPATGQEQAFPPDLVRSMIRLGAA